MHFLYKGFLAIKMCTYKYAEVQIKRNEHNYIEGFKLRNQTGADLGFSRGGGGGGGFSKNFRKF